MKIKVINKSKHKLPAYYTPLSAGRDMRTSIEDKIILKPVERIIVKTGLFLGIPDRYEAQIRPRCGLAINKGVTVLNSPGTINSDYRREVCVILVNLSIEDFVIKDGERICQMVIAKHEKAEWINVDNLLESERGAGGFVHTGKE